MRKDLLAGLAFLGVGVAVVKRNLRRQEQEQESIAPPTWEDDPWGYDCVAVGGELIEGGAACRLPDGEIVRR